MSLSVIRDSQQRLLDKLPTERTPRFRSEHSRSRFRWSYVFSKRPSHEYKVEDLKVSDFVLTQDKRTIELGNLRSRFLPNRECAWLRGVHPAQQV